MEEVLEIENGKQRAKVNIIEDYNENPPIEKIIIKDIHKMTDLHEVYDSENRDRIDLFYGKKRIYMTFRKCRKVRKEFSKFLIKTTNWVKVKPLKIEEKPISKSKKSN